jgi:hypothetical protein
MVIPLQSNAEKIIGSEDRRPKIPAFRAAGHEKYFFTTGGARGFTANLGWIASPRRATCAKETVMKIAFVAVAILISTQAAFAASTEPHTMAGKCAKANGGYLIPGTRRWHTDNGEAWASCMKSAGIASEPQTVQGRCAKANGGHHVSGTPHQWQTYNLDAWYKCINDHALAEKRAMGFKN